MDTHFIPANKDFFAVVHELNKHLLYGIMAFSTTPFCKLCWYKYSLWFKKSLHLDYHWTTGAVTTGNNQNNLSYCWQMFFSVVNKRILCAIQSCISLTANRRTINTARKFPYYSVWSVSSSLLHHYDTHYDSESYYTRKKRHLRITYKNGRGTMTKKSC